MVKDRLKVTLAGKSVLLPLRKVTVGWLAEAQQVKDSLIRHVRTSSTTKAMLEDPEIYELSIASQGHGSMFEEYVKEIVASAEFHNESAIAETEVLVVDRTVAEQTAKEYFAQKMQKAISTNPAFARAYLYPEVKLGSSVDAVGDMIAAVPKIADCRELTEEQLAELTKPDSEGWAEVELENLTTFCSAFCQQLT